jgi:hypothetical protein
MQKSYLATFALIAAGFVAGCNKNSDEYSGSPSTNGTSTNLMYPDSMATNEFSTNAMATNMASSAAGAWQSSKETGSNAWSETKQAGSNAWQSTTEFSTNAWDRTKAALAGGVFADNTNYLGYTFAQKDTFVSDAQTNIDHLDNRIARLSSTGNAGNSTLPDFAQAMQMVHDKRSELGNKLDDIKNASADNWDNAKAAYAKSYYDLTAALKTASDSSKANM